MESSEKIDVVDVVKQAPSGIRSLFPSVIKLNSDGIFVEPSCPFCLSQNRTEAESIFIKTPQYDNNKYTATKEFLDSKGEKFSIDLVKHHCNSHVNQGENQLRKQEYINTIDNISSIKISTIDEVDLLISALKERQIETARLVADSKTSKVEVEVIKSNIMAQLSKSFASLLKLRSELLGEQKESGDVIIISRLKFKQVFNEAIENAKGDEEKTLIIGLLKSLSKAEDKSSL